MAEYIVALDQGTTSSRAILFDNRGEIRAKAQFAFPQIYPYPGWVEHDPDVILKTQLDALRETFEKSGVAASEIAGAGITNQRETTIVWDRHTGRPVYNAIVWQCRRTAEFCDSLMQSGASETIRKITGLTPDAYFSGSKIRWILDNVDNARRKAENGDLLFGTVETWLIWNLTGGRVHITDYANASRTMLFDIHSLTWSRELCDMMGIPLGMLPKPVENSALYGYIDGKAIGIPDLDGIPICGAAGDQQAALFGQGCFEKGEAKNTYGTGCFTLLNTGSEIVESTHGLLSTVAWSVQGRLNYALEGSVFNGGSTIQWIRDELGIISEAPECDRLAKTVPDTGGVYVVPAFTGLGAPYWDAYARGLIIGITRGTGRAHICRAVLEGIAYQVHDLLDAMQADLGTSLPVLRVDGGASVSDPMMQFQADLLNAPVDRPILTETTAFGAACLAGLSAGVWNSLDELRKLRKTDRVYTPSGSREDMQRLHAGWKKAVERAKNWA